jgi:CIC family chloride channel protein
MIFEITRDYAVIVPLMISNLVSFFISARLQPKPIYDELAHQDGIHLPAAETRQQAAERQVNQAMREPSEVVLADTTVQEALERVKASGFRAWPVCDTRGVIGVVSLQRLRQAADTGFASQPLSQLIDASDFPHVHEDHPLHLALERMGATHLDLLPVVSRANVHELKGVITLEDTLTRYGVER